LINFKPEEVLNSQTKLLIKCLNKDYKTFLTRLKTPLFGDKTDIGIKTMTIYLKAKLNSFKTSITNLQVKEKKKPENSPLKNSSPLENTKTSGKHSTSMTISL
jgi:hypothetical protein